MNEVAEGPIDTGVQGRVRVDDQFGAVDQLPRFSNLVIELRRPIRGRVGVLRHCFRQAPECGLLRTDALQRRPSGPNLRAEFDHALTLYRREKVRPSNRTCSPASLASR